MTSSQTKYPLTLLQITDTHLYEESVGTLLKMNTRNSFQHVLNTVQENEEHVDLILATGDISQDASESAYSVFKSMVEVIDAPFRWIPGNHDVASVMEEVAEGSDACKRSERLGNWLILLLDSSIIGQVHGRLDSDELEFLRSSLSDAEASSEIENVLVTLHHNPIPGTAGWMKDIGLENSNEFFEVIKTSRKVRAVVYAHIHQALDFELQGVRFMCTPSTCIQFKPQVTNFTLDRLNPGYRRLRLQEDGSIDTEVVRVSGDTLEADYSSGGY